MKTSNEILTANVVETKWGKQLVVAMMIKTEKAEFVKTYYFNGMDLSMAAYEKEKRYKEYKAKKEEK